MELFLKKYAELSESEFIQIVQLIKMSGEVNPEMV